MQTSSTGVHMTLICRCNSLRCRLGQHRHRTTPESDLQIWGRRPNIPAAPPLTWVFRSVHCLLGSSLYRHSSIFRYLDKQIDRWRDRVSVDRPISHAAQECARRDETSLSVPLVIPLFFLCSRPKTLALFLLSLSLSLSLCCALVLACLCCLQYLPSHTPPAARIPPLPLLTLPHLPLPTLLTYLPTYLPTQAACLGILLGYDPFQFFTSRSRSTNLVHSISPTRRSQQPTRALGGIIKNLTSNLT
ncbi:hypothetical protein LX36DRAFT_455048 [Colletotrichum falcatum]|nr:hypothetical protein LX36DRAFT_455048 [Colletotrichum falcatum]